MFLFSQLQTKSKIPNKNCFHLTSVLKISISICIYPVKSKVNNFYFLTIGIHLGVICFNMLIFFILWPVASLLSHCFFFVQKFNPSPPLWCRARTPSLFSSKS